MPDWVTQHWWKWLFGTVGAGITALAGFLWGKLRSNKRLEDIEGRLCTLEKQVQAILTADRATMYDRLYYLHGKFCKQGWISVPDFQNYTNMYEGYHGLGGNGTGTELYEDIKELSKFPPAERKEKS